MSNIKETYIDHKRECLKDLSFKGIPEAIAKEIASLVESAQITKDDIDDYFRAMVKNMWETCSHGQCVHFFKNLQHKDLSHVRSKSRYICSAMRAIINNSHQEMFTDLYPRDCRPQWTTRDRTRHPYRLHTDHQGDKVDRYRASDLERSRPYPSVSSFREHRGPADVECQERSQQRLGWHCNNVSFKHQVNCLTGNQAPEVDSGFVRINNSCPEERSMNSLASIPTSALRRMCHSVNNKLVLNEQQLSNKGLFVENVQSNQSVCVEQFQRFDNMSVVRQFPQGTVPQARCPGIVPSSQELQQVPQHIPLSLLVLPPPPPPPGSPVIPVTSGTLSFPNYGVDNCVSTQMACPVVQPNIKNSLGAPSSLVGNQKVFAPGKRLSESGEEYSRHLIGPEAGNTNIPSAEAQDEDLRQALFVSQLHQQLTNDRHAVDSYKSLSHRDIQDPMGKSIKERSNKVVTEPVYERTSSFFHTFSLPVEPIPVPSDSSSESFLSNVHTTNYSPKHCAHGTDIERSCSRRDSWEKEQKMFRPWESHSLNRNRDISDPDRFSCKRNATSKWTLPVVMNNEREHVRKSQKEVDNRSAVDTSERQIGQSHKACISKPSDSCQQEYDHRSSNEDAKTRLSPENKCVQKADSTSEKTFNRKSNRTRGGKEGQKPIDICQKYKLSSVAMPTIDTRLSSLSNVAYPRVNTSFDSLSTVARPSICLRNTILDSYREFKLTSELFALGKVDKNMRNYLSLTKSESSKTLKRKKEREIPSSENSKKLKVNKTDRETDLSSIPVASESNLATWQTNKDGLSVSKESKLQAMHPKLRHKLPGNMSPVYGDSIYRVKKCIGDKIYSSPRNAKINEIPSRAIVTSTNEIDKSVKMDKDRKFEQRSLNGNKTCGRFVQTTPNEFALKTKQKSSVRSGTPIKKTSATKLNDLELLNKGCQAAKKGLIMRWKTKAASADDDKVAIDSADTTTGELVSAQSHDTSDTTTGELVSALSQDTSDCVKPMTDTLVDASSCSAENMASVVGAESGVGHSEGSQSSNTVIEAPSSLPSPSTARGATTQGSHVLTMSTTECCKSSVEKNRCTENRLDICDRNGLVEDIEQSDVDATQEVNECRNSTGTFSTRAETSSCIILTSPKPFDQSNGSNESPQVLVVDKCTFQKDEQLEVEVPAYKQEKERLVNDKKLDSAICYNELDQTTREDDCTSEIVCANNLIPKDAKYLQARQELSSVEQLPNKSDWKMLPPLLPFCGSSSSVWYSPTLEEFYNYRKSMEERIQADGRDGKVQTEDILSSPEQTIWSDNQQKACSMLTKNIETETSQENLNSEIYTATPLHESSFDTSNSYIEEVLNASVNSSHSSNSENVNCSQNETQTKDSIFDKTRHELFSATDNDDFLNLTESNDEILENIVLNMYEDPNLIHDLSDDFAKGDNFEFNDFHEKQENSEGDIESVMPNRNPEHEAIEDPVENQKLNGEYEQDLASTGFDRIPCLTNGNDTSLESLRNQSVESLNQQNNSGKVSSKRKHPKFEKKFPFSLPKAKPKPSEQELLASAEKFLQDFDKKNKRTRHGSKKMEQSPKECQPKEYVKESSNVEESQIEDEPVKRVTRTHTATMKNKQSKNMDGCKDSSGGKHTSDKRGPKEKAITAQNKAKQDDASEKTVKKDLVGPPKLPTLKLKSLKHINHKKMWSFKETTHNKSAESNDNDTMSDSGMVKKSKKSRAETQQCEGGTSNPDNDTRKSDHSADSEDLNEKKKQFLADVLTCKVCGLVAERKEEIDQHYLQQHPAWCLSCCKLFESVEALNLHKKRNHDVFLCCGVCNSVFCYKAHYIRHMTSSIHAKNVKEYQKRRQQQQRGPLLTVTISSDDENGENSNPRNVNNVEETSKRKGDINKSQKMVKKQKTREKDPKSGKNDAQKSFDPKGETTEDGLVLCLACKKYYKYFNKHLKSTMHENNVKSIVIIESEESESDEENEDESSYEELPEVISLKSSPHASEMSCTYNSDATDEEDRSNEQLQHPRTFNCGVDSENVLEKGCYDVVQNSSVLKLNFRPVHSVDLVKAIDQKVNMCSPALLVKNISADLNNNEHFQMNKLDCDREETATSDSANKVDLRIVKSEGSNVIEIIDNLADDSSDTEGIFEGVDMEDVYSYHDNDLDEDIVYTCNSAVDDPILEGFCVIENVETLSKESFRLDGSNEEVGNRFGLDRVVDVRTETDEMIEMLAKKVEQNLPRTSF